MASNIELIYNLLIADATLVGTLDPDTGYSGILQGGVWKRPLKANGFGQTPAAFYNGEKGNVMRPSAVLVDRGDNQHAQVDAIPTAYESFPLIYFYATATDSGKTAIRGAQNRVLDLLHNYHFQTEDGTWADLEYIDRVGILDSEEFIGCIYDYCRYRITSRKRNAV